MYFVPTGAAYHSLDFSVYLMHHFFAEIVVDVGTIKSGTSDHGQRVRVTFQIESTNQNLVLKVTLSLIRHIYVPGLSVYRIARHYQGYWLVLWSTIG